MQGCSLKQVLRKISQKLKDATAPEFLFNNTAGSQQIFTGGCFSNLLEISMAFGPVKKSSANVYISLKIESKHQITFWNIETISKSWIKGIYLKISKANTRDFLRKKVFLKILQISQENTFLPATFEKRDSSTDVFLWILNIFKNS